MKARTRKTYYYALGFAKNYRNIRREALLETPLPPQDLFSLTTNEFRRSFLEVIGVDPTKALSEESLAKPHQTYATPEEQEKQGPARFIRAISSQAKPD